MLPPNQNKNQYNYLELLCDNLTGDFAKWGATVFMQDGSPCHTARSVVGSLEDSNVSFSNDWLRSSHDLNPIKNLR